VTIPRNSVGSEQVKPGSLRASDFKASVRESLRGPRGRRGLTGAPGSVRAYATVSAEAGQQPIFTAVAPALAFAGVARTSTGTYCLSAPILTVPQRSAALASVREVGAGYLIGTQLCNNGIEVQTRDAAGVAIDNVDFNVWVP
jgi:hypothetical protein